MPGREPLKRQRWRRSDQKVGKCKRCGDEFAQETPWQLYCTNSCRVMAARDRKKNASQS